MRPFGIFGSDFANPTVRTRKQNEGVMAARPKGPNQLIEIAAFNRNNCFEAANLAHLETRKDELRRWATRWDEFAAGLKSSLVQISESRELLSRIEKELKL